MVQMGEGRGHNENNWLEWKLHRGRTSDIRPWMANVLEEGFKLDVATAASQSG